MADFIGTVLLIVGIIVMNRIHAWFRMMSE